MFQRFAECVRRAPLIIALGVILGAASPAAAQPAPKAEVSFGYVLLRDQDIYRETFPLGWNVDVALRLNTRLTIVGEVGGAYRNLDLLGSAFDLSVHTLLAGPRLSAWRSGRLSTFGQVLVGDARVRGSVFGETGSTTVLALQPGGGVDVRLTDLLGVRIAGDYRRLLAEGADEKEFRFVVGAVLRAGRK